MKTIAIKDVYALRDIKVGEELTYDYILTSVDQFAGMGFWILNCELELKTVEEYYWGLFPHFRRKFNLKSIETFHPR